MKNQTKVPAKTAGPAAPRSSTSKKHIPLKKIFCFIALAIIVVASGILTYRHDLQRKADERAYQADKARFAQVEKDMRTTKDKLTALIGQPSKEKYKTVCDHTSVKYGKGTLYCSVSYALVYRQPDSQSFQTQAKKLPSIFNNPNDKHSVRSQDKYLNDISTNSFGNLRLNGYRNVNCSLNAEYSNLEDREDFQDIKGSVAYYLYQCEADVRKAVYTLAE